MNDRSGEPRKVSPEQVQTKAQFADELTVLRTHAGLTVRDISRTIDAKQPHSTIGEWFAGRSAPSNGSRALYVEVLRACGVTADAEIERWLEAWRRIRQGPGPKGGITPYRGLVAFQPQDAEWFFGREALTEQIVDQVISCHAAGGGLQVVVGGSGSGKSSLLRAGVVPALSTDAARGRPAWPMVVLTPGAEPVRQLAAALAAGTRFDAAELAARIKTDPATAVADQVMTFISAARTISPSNGVPVPAPDRLLILVDQFEELFTMCMDEQERRTFVAALNAAAHSPVPREGPQLTSAVATVVVLVLRADFYPQASRYPEVAAALQNSQFVVGPLTEDELRRAIAEPATKANLQLDEGLVELLIRDASSGSALPGAVQSQAGSLPLLSHALLSTWQRAERGRMTTRGYLATGGIRGAVAETAETVYGDLSARQQALAQRMFLRLVNLGDDSTVSRRKVVRGELESTGGSAAELDDVIEHFIGARLLTMDADTVEISHEALITAWPRLHGWIDSDRDGIRRHRQLADAAKQWRDLDREPGSLYRGGRLHGVRDWAVPLSAGRDLNALETEFLAASLAAERDEHRTSRRRTHRLQKLIAALTVLAVLAAGLAGYAFWKRGVADRERDLAMSRQVAITADRVRATDPALAAQLSLAAYRIAPTVEARSSLLDATGSPSVTRIVRPSKGAQNVVLSPDGRTMFAAGTGPSDTAVLIWDQSDRLHPRRIGEPLTAHTLPVFGLAISPDGRVLATGGRDQAVRLWDVADPAHPAALGELPGNRAGTIYSLAFAPDGRTLAAGSSGRVVRLWNLDDLTRPALLKSLPALTGSAQSVAFDGSGRMLAAGDATGALYLWDIQDRRNPLQVSRTQTGSLQLNVVSFVPGKQELVVGGIKGLFQRWDVTKPAAPAKLPARIQVPENWVNSIAFSPNGRFVAIGSSENVAQVWDLTNGGQLVAALPHAEPVSSVTFTNGGRTVVTAGSDGVARLWSIPGPVITGPTATVAAAAFTPDGRSLAAFGGGAFLLNVAQPRVPVALGTGLLSPLPDEPISGAGALSPDGKTIAAGTTVNSVVLWDVSDPARPKALGPPLKGPTAVVESLAFSPDSHVLVAGADDGKVHLWDVSDPGRATALPVAPGADSNYVYTVAISPDGGTLAGVTADGMIRLWDLKDPSRLREFPPVKGSADLLFSTAFSRDGRVLATGSADGTVQLWDVSDPAALTPIGVALQGPDGTVTSVAFGPDRHILAAGTRSGQVWFWDVSTPDRPATVAILAASSAAVWAVGFSPDGHTVVTGGSDRTVRLWELDPTRAVDLICAAGGDSVSPDEWAKYLPGVPYEPVC
jgi:WD40 repeat protein